MTKKPLADTNRRVFEVLWVLLIFTIFYVGASSALLVYHALASAIEEVASFGGDAAVATQVPAAVHWLREGMSLLIAAILTPIGLRAADREKHCMLSQVGLKPAPGRPSIAGAIVDGPTKTPCVYSPGKSRNAAETKTESEDVR